jgi:hypothetical protein
MSLKPLEMPSINLPKLVIRNDETHKPSSIATSDGLIIELDGKPIPGLINLKLILEPHHLARCVLEIALSDVNIDIEGVVVENGVPETTKD